MNIAVIGSRDFQDHKRLAEVLSQEFQEGDRLVSGGAVGADRLAEDWCRAKGFSCLIFKPDWRTHGRSAGFKRNHTIIEHADKVIAFWKNRSKGTAHSLSLAKAKGISCIVIEG